MRERSTWDRKKIKMAAEQAGDVYTMNQDHKQPAMDQYVTGDPSDFAEDVHSPNTWEEEYSGDEVKRNELGMPEMRGDTFNHAEKTATLVKKANLCVEVATMMLRGKRVASESVIEDQALSLMYLPAKELLDTHTRLAQQQEMDMDGDEDGDDEQQKQAGDEMPDFIKDKIEEKKEDGEKKEAGQLPEALKKHMEEKAEGQQGQGQDQGEKKEAQESKGPEEVKNEGDDQNSKANDNWKAASDQIAQMQQQISQLQQMLQQAQGQQMPQQEPVMADDIDVMLAQDDCGPMAESDIQMDPAPMDVMASDADEVLRSIWANDDQEEDMGQEQAQQQSKQARTASTRTVGTRPNEGVAKLGGASKTASASSVDSLSSLWETAPDIRSTFGLK